jgi:hypothetical protein
VAPARRSNSEYHSSIILHHTGLVSGDAIPNLQPTQCDEKELSHSQHSIKLIDDQTGDDASVSACQQVQHRWTARTGEALSLLASSVLVPRPAHALAHPLTAPLLKYQRSCGFGRFRMCAEEGPCHCPEHVASSPSPQPPAQERARDEAVCSNVTASLHVGDLKRTAVQWRSVEVYGVIDTLHSTVPKTWCCKAPIGIDNPHEVKS